MYVRVARTLRPQLRLRLQHYTTQNDGVEVCVKLRQRADNIACIMGHASATRHSAQNHQTTSTWPWYAAACMAVHLSSSPTLMSTPPLCERADRRHVAGLGRIHPCRRHRLEIPRAT